MVVRRAAPYAALGRLHHPNGLRKRRQAAARRVGIARKGWGRQHGNIHVVMIVILNGAAAPLCPLWPASGLGDDKPVKAGSSFMEQGIEGASEYRQPRHDRSISGAVRAVPQGETQRLAEPDRFSTPYVSSLTGISYDERGNPIL